MHKKEAYSWLMANALFLEILYTTTLVPLMFNTPEDGRHKKMRNVLNTAHARQCRCYIVLLN